jgi:hypothetical protein
LNDRRDWLKWLDTAGIADADLSHGTVFNQASMAIDAAVDGQGIALARTALTAWDLRTGRLVRPFDLALSVPYAYWIVCPRVNADLPKVATFRHWLLAQAEKDATHGISGARGRDAPRQNRASRLCASVGDGVHRGPDLGTDRERRRRRSDQGRDQHI